MARRPGVARWEDQDFVGQVSPSSITDVGRHRTAGRSSGSSTYGLKSNIVRAMRRRGVGSGSCRTRSRPSVALARDIDGLILSPGPGDPARLDGPVALAQAVIDDGRPLLGICLGHQIVARAAGAETTRLRFGHHGANHPVRDVDLGLVQVTAQNHEVQVVGDVAAGRVRVPASARSNLNDGSGRGPAPRDAADRDRPVPPGGRAGPARRARRVRPVRGRAPRGARDRRGTATRASVTRRKPASVLILGSGPVVIGQAAEFDYAGTQACRALRAEGVRTILVNSQPGHDHDRPGRRRRRSTSSR